MTKEWAVIVDDYRPICVWLSVTRDLYNCIPRGIAGLRDYGTTIVL